MDTCKTNQRFVQWTIAEHEKMDPGVRENFIDGLMRFPYETLQTIKADLEGWKADAEQELGSFDIVDLDGAAEEIFQALKKHFVKEPAKVT